MARQDASWISFDCYVWLGVRVYCRYDTYYAVPSAVSIDKTYSSKWWFKLTDAEWSVRSGMSANPYLNVKMKRWRKNSKCTIYFHYIFIFKKLKRKISLVGGHDVIEFSVVELLTNRWRSLSMPTHCIYQTQNRNIFWKLISHNYDNHGGPIKSKLLGRFNIIKCYLSRLCILMHVWAGFLI